MTSPLSAADMYLVSTGAVRGPSYKADRLGKHENQQISQNPQAGVGSDRLRRKSMGYDPPLPWRLYFSGR